MQPPFESNDLAVCQKIYRNIGNNISHTFPMPRSIILQEIEIIVCENNSMITTLSDTVWQRGTVLIFLQRCYVCLFVCFHGGRHSTCKNNRNCANIFLYVSQPAITSAVDRTLKTKPATSSNPPIDQRRNEMCEENVFRRKNRRRLAVPAATRPHQEAVDRFSEQTR